jgi:hypothetical protein
VSGPSHLTSRKPTLPNASSVWIALVVALLAGFLGRGLFVRT